MLFGAPCKVSIVDLACYPKLGSIAYTQEIPALAHYVPGFKNMLFPMNIT